MLSGQNVDADDIAVLSQILEGERKSAASKRAVCFAISTLMFLFLLGTFAVIAYQLLQTNDRTLIENLLPVAGMLAPLFAAVLTFFHLGCGAQNCINSIERSLVAARHGRHKLFVTFVQQVQCADKDKRKVIMEWVGVLVGT